MVLRTAPRNVREAVQRSTDVPTLEMMLDDLINQPLDAIYLATVAQMGFDPASA